MKNVNNKVAVSASRPLNCWAARLKEELSENVAFMILFCATVGSLLAIAIVYFVSLLRFLFN